MSVTTALVWSIEPAPELGTPFVVMREVVGVAACGAIIPPEPPTDPVGARAYLDARIVARVITREEGRAHIRQHARPGVELLGEVEDIEVWA